MTADFDYDYHACNEVEKLALPIAKWVLRKYGATEIRESSTDENIAGTDLYVTGKHRSAGVDVKGCIPARKMDLIPVEYQGSPRCPQGWSRDSTATCDYYLVVRKSKAGEIKTYMMDAREYRDLVLEKLEYWREKYSFFDTAQVNKHFTSRAVQVPVHEFRGVLKFFKEMDLHEKH